MSIFGAMTTAISGLSSQSNAFANIGDNLANTQTTGYKGVDTTFENYVTDSSLQTNGAAAVVARPDYTNSQQGTIAQNSNPLNLAISGQGFFSVSVPNGTMNGQPTFSSQQLYTREGDFSLNAQQYLVNSTGHFLNAWPADSAGQIDQTKVVPLQVTQSAYAPVPTSTAKIAANLPATPSSTAPVTTEVPVYDSVGTSHNLDLTWTPTSTANVWSLSVASGSTNLGSADVTFGAAGNASAPEGTIGAVTATSGSLTGSTFGTGQQATVGLSADFGLGAQPITLDLGMFGGTDGVTQFAGSSYNLISLSQNGVEPGGFSGVSMQTNGDVTVNYDNGQSRIIGQVPLVMFRSPDSLEPQDGQAYLATKESGTAQVTPVASNGSGSLVTSSLEGSNVDIATEFTKLIVAQRAYSANTKMVTTADDMLQQTIDMKR